MALQIFKTGHLGSQKLELSFESCRASRILTVFWYPSVHNAFHFGRLPRALSMGQPAGFWYNNLKETLWNWA